jgi:hypothetical protein
LLAFQLCLLRSYYVPQWRAASLSRGDIHSLMIRQPLFPQLADHSRPRKGQGPYGGLVILASPALLAITGLRPLGVLDRLPGNLVERLAETCGATPPAVRHGHVATALDDRGHTGEGESVLDVFIPTPIRAQRTDEARGMHRTGPRSRRKKRKILVCTGEGVTVLFNPRDRVGHTADLRDQGVHEHDRGAHDRLIGGGGDRLANPCHPRLVDGAMVCMMRLKKRPQRRVISLLDRFQGGPAREEVTDEWRVEGCEPA